MGNIEQDVIKSAGSWAEGLQKYQNQKNKQLLKGETPKPLYVTRHFKSREEAAVNPITVFIQCMNVFHAVVFGLTHEHIGCVLFESKATHKGSHTLLGSFLLSLLLSSSSRSHPLSYTLSFSLPLSSPLACSLLCVLTRSNPPSPVPSCFASACAPVLTAAKV